MFVVRAARSLQLPATPRLISYDNIYLMATLRCTVALHVAGVLPPHALVRCRAVIGGPCLLAPPQHVVAPMPLHRHRCDWVVAQE